MNANDFALRSQIISDVLDEAERQDTAGEPAIQYVSRRILVRIAARTLRVLEQADRQERAR